MPRSLIRRALTAVLAASGAAAVLLVPGSAALADPTPPPGTPTATSFDGVPTVGPLFHSGLDVAHSCTASVLASPRGDLIVTAAHCVSGTAVGWSFAPGYDEGRTPYGVWTVTGAYVEPGWLGDQDPDADLAILSVADQRWHGRTAALQDVTGGNVLEPAPRTGTTITDIAYNAGIDDQPITCTVPVYYTDGYPSFNCHGSVGGSSGSPWLSRLPGHRYAVRGVIGGLHQGGCYEYTSYSAPFDGGALRLLARAAAGGPADTVPKAGGDGC
jgi:trypsin